jgi:hypothetical protein
MLHLVNNVKIGIDQDFITKIKIKITCLKKPSPYTGDLKNAELAEPYSDLINK